MSDPSPPAESRADQQPPRDHLGWVLAATVLCFLPLGLGAFALGVVLSLWAISRELGLEPERWRSFPLPRLTGKAFTYNEFNVVATKPT